MSFLPPILTPIAQGICAGAQMNFFSRVTNMSREARKDSEKQNPAEAFVQIQAQSFVVAIVNKALQATGRIPISSTLGWVFFLTPALAFLGAQILPQGMIRSSIEGLQDQIGRICLVAFVVSQLVLVYFGTGPGAPISLVFLGAHWLGSSQWLPNKISAVYGKTLWVASIVSGLFLLPVRLGSYINFALNQALQSFLLPKPATPAPNVSGCLTGERFEKILRGEETKKNYEINEQHIGWCSLPAIPPIHPNLLLKLWDTIAWDKDPRYAPFFAGRRAKLEEAVAFLSEMPSHRHVHMHLLLIAAQLKRKTTTDAERKKHLWKLASDDIGKESLLLFAKLTERSGSTAFPKRVLQELQMFRTELAVHKKKSEAADPTFGGMLAGPVGAQIYKEDMAMARLNAEMLSWMSRGMSWLTGVRQSILPEVNYTIPSMISRIHSRAQLDPSFKTEMNQWWDARLQKFSPAERAALDRLLGEEKIEATEERMILSMFEDLHIVQFSPAKQEENLEITQRFQRWDAQWLKTLQEMQEELHTMQGNGSEPENLFSLSSSLLYLINMDPLFHPDVLDLRDRLVKEISKHIQNNVTEENLPLIGRLLINTRELDPSIYPDIHALRELLIQEKLNYLYKTPRPAPQLGALGEARPNPSEHLFEAALSPNSLDHYRQPHSVLA
jgi:hypothetical protein